MRVQYILLLASASGIGACSHLPAENPRYLCGELEVTADFSRNDRVKLIFGDRILVLPHVPAASGAKYADTAGNEFWTRETALLTLAGQPVRKCLRASGS
jgi:membrane-bound inhibitor of C-type lysozyme